MDTTKRKPHPALIESLLREPATFEFFQAVHLLELQAAAHAGGRAGKPVGFDHAPGDEGLRFRTAPSLAFPVHPLTAVRPGDGAGDATYELLVTFLGLVGPAGTLPRHYTESLLSRLQQKDGSLQDFLDALQHRGVSLFYRAWRKYRLPVAYTSTRRERGEADPILTALLALVGRGSRPAGQAFAPAELALVHHGGHFSNRRRSAEGLRVMLAGLLGCNVRVDEFVGEWVELDEAALSRLGSGRPGTLARLGDETVLGTRVWSVDARVRVTAGPMDRRRFRELWPGSPRLAFLKAVVRSYLGPLLDCELVWELAENAPAIVRLGGDQLLGRDCWLGWSDVSRADMRVTSPPGTIRRPGGS